MFLKDYKNIDGVAAFSHSTGCGMELSGEPMNLLNRTLGGYICHPNVASSLVISSPYLQARRDSNPQQADLESAALPIGATRLNEGFPSDIL